MKLLGKNILIKQDDTSRLVGGIFVPSLPQMQYSGQVLAVGAAVKTVQVGDSVMYRNVGAGHDIPAEALGLPEGEYRITHEDNIEWIGGTEIVKPLRSNVVVRKPLERKTSGGIILQEKAEAAEFIADVIAVSDSATNVKVGDTVQVMYEHGVDVTQFMRKTDGVYLVFLEDEIELVL